MSAKTIYKTLAPFFDAVDGTEEKALKFTSPGYMDLCIEALGYKDHEGRPVYSVAHYGERHGSSYWWNKLVRYFEKERAVASVVIPCELNLCGARPGTVTFRRDGTYCISLNHSA